MVSPFYFLMFRPHPLTSVEFILFVFGRKCLTFFFGCCLFFEGNVLECQEL